MHDIFVFALGAAIGGVIAGLWVNIRIRWSKARNQLRAPQKARQELQEKVKKAKGEYDQGWRELRTAFWQMVVLVIFLAICFTALTNYLAYMP
jgi:uncharacterized membrane protein (DUF106 family)